ncbi:hypothetical protein [Neorhizobium sp. T25_13]|jgi:hypothetical protein|uniref:hypothetical protein n=1 Tax=Neorhizobium sp. T25_13 TaxID=2093830 RepID=UPI000CF9A1AD|nr:hypothetical protein [Neorhizobium sp. T25_13]
MDRHLEDWEMELLASHETSIREYEDLLRALDAGERIILPDLGDVTDDERKKAEWFLACHKANLLKLREGAANDNEPPMDEELADLIAGDW